MKALITGINGQDGAYLTALLAEKKYDVYGIMRKVAPLDNLEFCTDYSPHLFFGDVAEPDFVDRVISEVKPDEIYNFAAQSHVGQSFQNPLTTMQTNYGGLVNIINSAKRHCRHTKIYQAGTSEMFGYSAGNIANENTPFSPKSPYAISKVAAHWAGVNARKEGIFVANGILFNHESPIRGLDFVTRKISAGIAAISLGQQDKIYLGNIKSKRDWGFAGDYVDGMWRMLQQETPGDFVLATGEVHSVMDFVSQAAKLFSYDPEDIISISNENMRPNDLEYLCGDFSKAREVLGWKPKVGFSELVEMMVVSDVERLI